jgi:hypothetical protein
MLLQEDVGGTGAKPLGVETAKELTAVVQWDTGRKNTRGGKIFLRKYVHLGIIGAADHQAAKGNSALAAADVQAIVDYANKVKNAVGISGANITDKKGRGLPVATPAVVLPHLHTRQFRR